MEKEKREIPSAIYNFHGNVGPLIHHVDTLNMTLDKDMNVRIQNVEELHGQQHQQPTTSPTSTQPDLQRLKKYFSNNYLTTRHAEYVAMIDICCGDFTDREKAYFAWKIYDTDTIMNTITRPKTFSAWYEIFCEIFHVTHHSNYYPKDIKDPSDNAKIIDNYVYSIHNKNR